MNKEKEKKTENWKVLYICPKQEDESEYEPTEEELLDQFAKIISDIYLREYHGIHRSEEESL